ncbi:hypothetical protein K438DRAFT_1875713, partial [Mycena galopus ATCC 62051]
MRGEDVDPRPRHRHRTSFLSHFLFPFLFGTRGSVMLLGMRDVLGIGSLAFFLCFPPLTCVWISGVL